MISLISELRVGLGLSKQLETAKESPIFNPGRSKQEIIQLAGTRHVAEYTRFPGLLEDLLLMTHSPTDKTQPAIVYCRNSKGYWANVTHATEEEIELFIAGKNNPKIYLEPNVRENDAVKVGVEYCHVLDNILRR